MYHWATEYMPPVNSKQKISKLVHILVQRRECLHQLQAFLSGCISTEVFLFIFYICYYLTDYYAQTISIFTINSYTSLQRRKPSKGMSGRDCPPNRHAG